MTTPAIGTPTKMPRIGLLAIVESIVPAILVTVVTREAASAPAETSKNCSIETDLLSNHNPLLAM